MRGKPPLGLLVAQHWYCWGWPRPTVTRLLEVAWHCSLLCSLLAAALQATTHRQALLSEVQVERVNLAEGSLHFRSHHSWHWALENPGCMSHRNSWSPLPHGLRGFSFRLLSFVE